MTPLSGRDLEARRQGEEEEVLALAYKMCRYFHAQGRSLCVGCRENADLIRAALLAERQRTLAWAVGVAKSEYAEIVKEARALCDDSCLCSATQQKIEPLRAAVEKQYQAAVDAQRADPSKEFS